MTVTLSLTAELFFITLAQRRNLRGVRGGPVPLTFWGGGYRTTSVPPYFLAGAAKM